MEEKRVVKGSRFLLAFFIATFIFLFIFLFSYSIIYIKSNGVNNDQIDIKYNLLQSILERQLENSCNNQEFYSSFSELDNMGSSLALLESRLGKNDKSLLEQKKRYVLLEVQHFLEMQRFDESCGKNITFVFFFYSNKDNYIKSAERIGYILDTLKTKHPDKIMTYSLDYDLDSKIVEILKSKYNVASPNTVIINGKSFVNFNNINSSISAISGMAIGESVKIVDVKKIEELEKYLNK